MSIIDLETRLTDSWNAYSACAESADSLVCIEGARLLPADSKVAIDLTIGSQYWDYQNNRFWAIGDDGLYIAPKSGIVVETEQKLFLPYNVFGIVTGKGSLIYRAVIICPGKIDPAFQGKLRIGVHNGGQSAVVLRRGEAFCSCVFLSLESSAKVPLRAASQPETSVTKTPFKIRAARFWNKNWDKIVPILVSSLSLLVAIGSLATALMIASRKQ